MNEAFIDLSAVVSRWRIWFLMGQQDIFMRYRRSVLGPFWISLTMCVFVLALAFLYSTILNQPFRTYIAFLAAGLFVWTLLISFIIDGANMIVENEHMLGNAPIPLSVLAGRTVYRNAIIFGHNLIAVLAMLIFFGTPITWVALAAIPGVALILTFGLFTSLAIGPLCARFRDIPQILQNLTQILFFVTPVMWMPAMASHRPLLAAANPFYHMLELVRAPLLGHFPTAQNWLVASAFVAVIGIISLPLLAWSRRRVYLWL